MNKYLILIPAFAIALIFVVGVNYVYSTYGYPIDWVYFVFGYGPLVLAAILTWHINQKDKAK